VIVRHVVEYSRRACQQRNERTPYELGRLGGIAAINRSMGMAYLFALDLDEGSRCLCVGAIDCFVDPWN